mgnify:CR=1 FL=1
MTTITFRMEGDRITGFDSTGHSGYAEEGEDIVCAAVSSAVNLVNATVNDVLGLAAAVRVDPDNAWLSFHLPGGLSVTDEATCQNLLAGLMVYFAELHQAYPDFFQVVDDSPEDNDPE